MEELMGPGGAGWAGGRSKARCGWGSVLRESELIGQKDPQIPAGGTLRTFLSSLSALPYSSRASFFLAACQEASSSSMSASFMSSPRAR